MNLPDLINGTFEASGSLWILDHCRALIRTKQARGVSLGACLFFTGWGVWNIYYYPHLSQWLSFAGGIAIVVANMYWNGLIIYYRWKERHGI
jgi:hypothetical protein